MCIGVYVKHPLFLRTALFWAIKQRIVVFTDVSGQPISPIFQQNTRTNNVVNHALVFMLPGLHKQWKQPVAYCLIHRTVKGQKFVNFFMEVFDTYYNAGVEVVATMCDVGSNSVQSLEHQGVPVKIFSSGFRVKNLQLYLIIPIPLNVPTALS